MVVGGFVLVPVAVRASSAKIVARDIEHRQLLATRQERRQDKRPRSAEPMIRKVCFRHVRTQCGRNESASRERELAAERQFSECLAVRDGRRQLRSTCGASAGRQGLVVHVLP